MLVSTLKSALYIGLFLSVLVGCDSDDGLEPIEEVTEAQNNSACNDVEGSASFENNFGLRDFCIDYTDKGGGLVAFNFVKTQENGVGSFAIELPHTEIGHVFTYNTKSMIEEHESAPDHCEMLKSISKFPAVTLRASDGEQIVEASSLDCDKNNFFDVTVNTIKVPEKSGDKWVYELNARYARQEKGPYYLKGRFEVVKR